MVHTPAKCANLNLESLSLCLSLSNHRMNLRAHLYLSLSLFCAKQPVGASSASRPLDAGKAGIVHSDISSLFPFCHREHKKETRTFSDKSKEEEEEEKKVLKQASSSGNPDRQCRHENGIALSESTIPSVRNPPIDRKTHHWRALHPSKSKLAEQTCSLTRATTRKEPLVWPGKRSYGFSSTWCMFLVLAPSPLAPPNH